MPQYRSVSRTRSSRWDLARGPGMRLRVSRSGRCPRWTNSTWWAGSSRLLHALISSVARSITHFFQMWSMRHRRTGRPFSGQPLFAWKIISRSGPRNSGKIPTGVIGIVVEGDAAPRLSNLVSGGVLARTRSMQHEALRPGPLTCSPAPYWKRSLKLHWTQNTTCRFSVKFYQVLARSALTVGRPRIGLSPIWWLVCSCCRRYSRISALRTGLELCGVRLRSATRHWGLYPEQNRRLL